MKNFLLNVLKGLCYVALYLAAQTIASYLVVFVTALSMSAQNPVLLETDTGLATLMRQVYDAALSNSSLILLIAAAVTLLVLFVFFRARGKRLTRETWFLPVRVQSLWPVALAGVALAVVICYGIALIPWPAQMLESYEELQAYYGPSALVPVYICVEDGLRLERAIAREREQAVPKYKELCRRFLADEEDFKEENLLRCGITKQYENLELETCIEQIVRDILAESGEPGSGKER